MHDSLVKLRSEHFQNTASKRLKEHPFITAAEEGKLSAQQRHNFIVEQYWILISDALTFAFLAKERGPTIPITNGQKNFFGKLVEGEQHALKLLISFAAEAGINEGELKSSRKAAGAQAYAACLAQLALNGSPVQVAAACAINFKSWGEACGRLRDASAKGKCAGWGEAAVKFLSFFAVGDEELDQMVSTIVEEQSGKYEDLVDATRQLQECEVMFWDSVFTNHSQI